MNRPASSIRLARRDGTSQWWAKHPAAYAIIAAILGVIALACIWVLWRDQRKLPILPWRKSNNDKVPNASDHVEQGIDPASDPSSWRGEAGPDGVVLPVRKKSLGSSVDTFNLHQKSYSQSSTNTASLPGAQVAPPAPAYPFRHRPESYVPQMRSPPPQIITPNGSMYGPTSPTYGPTSPTYGPTSPVGPTSPTTPTSPITPISPAFPRSPVLATSSVPSLPRPVSAISDLSGRGLAHPAPSAPWAPLPSSSPPLPLQPPVNRLSGNLSPVSGTAAHRTSATLMPSPLANVTTPNGTLEDPMDAAGRKLRTQSILEESAGVGARPVSTDASRRVSFNNNNSPPRTKSSPPRPRSSPPRPKSNQYRNPTYPASPPSAPWSPRTPPMSPPLTRSPPLPRSPPALPPGAMPPPSIPANSGMIRVPGSPIRDQRPPKLGYSPSQRSPTRSMWHESIPRPNTAPPQKENNPADVPRANPVGTAL